MGSRLPAKTSALVYGLCAFCFALMLPLFKKEFSKNLIMLSVAGFLGSMTLVFIVITLGQIYITRGIREKPGFIAILVVANITYFLCFYVHYLCFFLCFAFSIPMIIYLVNASQMKTPNYFIHHKK